MKLNNKKNIIFEILFLIIIFTFVSCEKFLQEKPTGTMSANVQLTSVEQGEALTIGAYRMLPGWVGAAGDWGNILPNILEYWTGKSYSNVAIPQQWRWESNQIDGNILNDFNNYWQYQYDGVRDCNNALELLPNVTMMTEGNRLKAQGEVRTLRAFYFFNLVRYFGDVVMTTESITNPENFQQPRTSLKTIYDEVIIPDLLFAVNESGLDEGQSSGRITKDVARAILADVYLTCAGYPYQEVATDPERNWCVDGSWTMEEYPVNSASAIDFLKKAKEQLDALYGQYALGTYDDLRDPNLSHSGEAIFQISMLGGVSEMRGEIQATLPQGTHVTYFPECNGTNIPTIGYYNSYSPNDLRKQEKEFFFTYDYASDLFDVNNPREDFNQPYLYKFFDPNIKKEPYTSLNWTFYRYADILLMLTEVNWSLNELGQSVSSNDIEKGINEVRERALLPPIGADNLTLKDILSERAYELIFENKLLWDMRRTRKALVNGDGSFTRLENFIGNSPDIFSYKFSPFHLLAPIGNEEIQVNAECLQNSGYLPKQIGQ